MTSWFPCMPEFLVLSGTGANVGYQPAIGVALLFSCLASFLWGMIFFFHLPHGPTSGVWAIRGLGSVFGVWSLMAVAVASPGMVRCVLAWLCYLASLALFWWAWYSTRNQPLAWAFTGVVGDQVNRTGAYAFVRHPFYLAYCLTWLGASLVDQLLLLPAITMSIIYFRAASAEEKMILAGPMGPSYRDYAASVGMFFPSPKSLRGMEPVE